MKTTNALLVTAIVGMMALSAVAEDKLPPVAKPVSTPVYKIPEPEPETSPQQYEQFTAARVFHPPGVTCNNPACTTCTKAAAPACAVPAREPSCEAQVRRLPPAGDPTCAAYGPVGDPTCAAYPPGDPSCAAEPHAFTTRGSFAPSFFTYSTESGPTWNFPVYRIVKREAVERPTVWIQGMHLYYKDRQLAYKSWSLEREEFEAQRAARNFTNASAQLGSSATSATMREYVQAEAKFNRKQSNVAIKQAELACELEEQLHRRAQLQMKRDQLNYRD